MAENEIEKLKKELQNCKDQLKRIEKEKEDYIRGWQRARADFLNYKREESERLKKIIESCKEKLIFELLPILDNFEKAAKINLEENFSQQKALQVIEGFLQIKKQLEDFLKKEGVVRLETKNKKFDPNFHEAVQEIEVEGKQEGEILEEVQGGYLFKGKLLRPAKVKVAK